MEKYGAKIKKFLLAGILLVMLLPLIQQHVKFHESKKLKGAHVPAPEAYFSMNSWMSGDFQQAYENWFNENFGFRPELVRVHNEIAYDLYHEAKANSVIIGKENYLYEESYLKAYTGKDFIGRKQIAETTNKLRMLQDSLEKKGTTLIVCLAAGKASFYPEYIPDAYGPASDSTNYKVFAQCLNELHVNHIDYNNWFMNMKGHTDFPLYPKTGIHWSRYGSLLATDSLIHYVEAKRNVDMPEIVWEKTVFTDTLDSPDGDIGDAMNLVWPIQHFPMGHPVYHFGDTTGKAHVRMMTISDSFFWNMFDIGLAPSTFSDIRFYYYNNEVYCTDGTPFHYADLETEMKDADQADVVVLMATESNLFGFGWGFINDAFNHFVLHKMVQTQDGLTKKYQAMIRMDENWMKTIQAKAQKNNISVDSMIYLDAKYMADEEWKKNNAK
jgi:hypothetical protein